jgi:hypothetical protein
MQISAIAIYFGDRSLSSIAGLAAMRIWNSFEKGVSDAGSGFRPQEKRSAGNSSPARRHDIVSSSFRRGRPEIRSQDEIVSWPADLLWRSWQ